MHCRKLTSLLQDFQAGGRLVGSKGSSAWGSSRHLSKRWPHSFLSERVSQPGQAAQMPHHWWILAQQKVNSFYNKQIMKNLPTLILDHGKAPSLFLKLPLQKPPGRKWSSCISQVTVPVSQGRRPPGINQCFPMGHEWLVIIFFFFFSLILC